MKKIIGTAIFLISIFSFGEDFDIEQPLLEEVSTMNIKNEIKSNEIIIGIVNEINKLRTENIMIQKKIDIMDKVIQDKNQLADELENKVEILALQLKKIEENNKIGEKNFGTLLNEGIIKIAAAAGLLILLLFIIVIGIIFSQNGKNRKMLEDWRDLNDINRGSRDREDYKKNVKKSKDKELDDMELS